MEHVTRVIGRVGRKRHQHDIFWHDELWRTVPTSTVEDQRGDGTDADAFADFGQMFVHRLDADCRYDQRCAGAARRADGAEQVGPGEPPVAPDARTRAALGPDAGQRASAFQRGVHPETRFRPAGRQAPAGLRCAQAQRSFCKGLLCLKVALRVHGTSDMLLKFSFFSSLPTLRSQGVPSRRHGHVPFVRAIITERLSRPSAQNSKQNHRPSKGSARNVKRNLLIDLLQLRFCTNGSTARVL